MYICQIYPSHPCIKDGGNPCNSMFNVALVRHNTFMYAAIKGVYLSIPAYVHTHIVDSVQ